MKQKLILWVTVICLLMNSFVFATDYSGHWAEADIKAGIADGWISGDAEGQVRPKDEITRAEFVVMYNAAFDIPFAPGLDPYTDVPRDAWYYRPIINAKAKKLITGYPDGTFRPNAKITKQEAAVIIAKSLDNKNVSELEYTDTDKIAPWAIDSVKLLQNAEVIKGNQNGEFSPKANITRAETIVMFSNARKFNEEKSRERSLARMSVIRNRREEEKKNNTIINKEEDKIEYVGSDLARDYENLDIIYARGDSQYSITQDVELITEGEYGSDISWESDEPDYLDEEGNVTRPTDESKIFNLTATLRNDGEKLKKKFEVKVVKESEDGELGSITKLEDIYDLNNGESIDFVVGEDNAIEYIGGKYTNYRVESLEDAIYSLNAIKDIMGIDDPEEQFEGVSTEDFLDNTMFKIGQVHNGVEVFGKEIVITADREGEIQSLIGDYELDIDISTTPTLSEEEAVEIAIGDEELENVEENKLVIYTLDGNVSLAWQISVVSTEESDEFISKTVFVDANDGDIINELDNIYYAKSVKAEGMDLFGKKQSFYVQKDIAYYKMVDLERKIYVFDKHAFVSMENILGSEVVKSLDNTWEQPEAVSAYINTQKTFDFYKNVLGRNSINNKGGYVYVTVNADIIDGGENAYWSRGQMFLGDGGGNTVPWSGALDLVGHEYTHGVTSYTAKLIYQDASGALNEAYSDIMGEIIEQYYDERIDKEWLHAEDIQRNARANRNISNPEEFKMPKELNGKYYVEPGGDDHGGVHTNMSIVTRAAYLMWENGINNWEELAKLWYGSLLKLTKTSDYFDCRNAVLASAKDLKMSDKKVQIIKDAFDEVKIYDKSEKADLTIKLYYSDFDTDNTNNKVIANQKMTLKENAQGAKEISVKTNSEGEYGFEELKAGTYILTINKDGYLPKDVIIYLAEDKVEEIYLDTDKTVTLSGRVTIADDDTDMTNNEPLKEAKIYLWKETGTLPITSNYEAGKLKTNSNGEYSLEGLTPGVYDIAVIKDGYIRLNQYGTIIRDDTDLTMNFILEAISEEYAGEGTARGTIKDMQTGYGVEDLTLVVREGLNNISRGEIVYTTTTNSSGKYEVNNIPAGNYTIQIIDNSDRTEKYLDNFTNIKILGNSPISNQDGLVTKQVMDGAIRVVLRWGEKPKDIDTYVYRVDGERTQVIRYDNKTYKVDDEKYISLDVDDRNGYGPETTTFYSDAEGVYRYYVWNAAYTHDNTLNTSGATVYVYDSNSNMPIYVFSVPSQSGNWWEVFEYNASSKKINILSNMQTVESSGTKY